MTKADFIKDFLIKTESVILYNGENYTIVNKNDEVITVTLTTEEIYYFIHGYNVGLNKCFETNSYENLKDDDVE